tara:strand:- start:902 stop:1474 length:573 start_codon:yes stop_codon:yes gene_type:complete
MRPTDEEYKRLLEMSMLTGVFPGMPTNDAGSGLGNLMLDSAAGLGQGVAKYDKAVTPFANSAQERLTGLIGRAGGATRAGSAVGRFAGSAKALGLLKALPAAGAVGGVLGAGDIVFGGDSAANKVMDGTAMAIGGFLGAPGGPLGMAAGAGLGKMVSDGVQGLGGLLGIESQEERRKRELMEMLSSSGMV